MSDLRVSYIEMRRVRWLAVGLAVMAIGLAGCGGDDDETSAEDPVTTGTQEAPEGLERFLMASGEEPGFKPSGPVERVSNAEDLVGPGGRTQAGARELRDMGFVSLAARPIEGKEGPGISSLMLFKSAAGAKRSAAEDRRNLEVDFRGWKVKRFDVPDVPGAFGWTATRPDQRVGNIIWVEGRCVMTLGNAEAKTFEAPLTAGVKAMHRRIAGRCP